MRNPTIWDQNMGLIDANSYELYVIENLDQWLVPLCAASVASLTNYGVFGSSTSSVKSNFKIN